MRGLIGAAAALLVGWGTASAATVALPNGLQTRDFSLHAASNTLYIAASDGVVLRYDLTTGMYLDPITLGGTLSSLDVSADGTTLYVGQRDLLVPGDPTDFDRGGTGAILRVDLATGGVTNLTYTTTFGEGGVTDVAVGQGTALATTRYLGSGWTPLRQIDTATGAVSINPNGPDGPGGQVRGGSFLQASSSDRYILLTENNISSYPISIYDTLEGRFVAATDNRAVPQLPGFADGVVAISEEAGLVAVQSFDGRIVFLDLDLNFVAEVTLPDFVFEGGVAFSADGSLLYALYDESFGVGQDALFAFDTLTFEIAFEQALDFDLLEFFDQFGPGNLLTVNPNDGSLIIDQETAFVILQPLLTSALAVPIPAAILLFGPTFAIGVGARRRRSD